MKDYNDEKMLLENGKYKIFVKTYIYIIYTHEYVF